MQNIKQSLIEEINKRVQDKILEPANAELLKKLINNAESSEEAINIAALGTTYKRTGLHFDKRLEKMTDSIKYFKKNEKLSFRADDAKPVNKLIIGDNYQALQNLLIQYKGQIDVIYIDPPYGKDSMGEFAKTNYTNAITRDNLLSMLYPRLILAKQLLSDEGLIFCSIDDKNQAYVKCLFDEVFGEENSLSVIAWEKRTKCQNTDTAKFMLQPKVEYILCYKNFNHRAEFRCHVVGEKLYPEKDAYGIFRYEEIGQMSKNGVRGRASMIFDILGVYPNEGNQWKLGKDTILEYSTRNDGKDLLLINERPFRKIRPEDEAVENYKPFWGMYGAEQYGTAETAKSELDKILGTKEHDFNTVKPVELIEDLIFHACKENSIVLDFFAGSGTTGQSTMEYVKDYHNNITYILCTNNEKTEKCPNGIAYDVTSKRLKRIMTGECYDGTKDFPWLKDNQPYGGNLDVYEIESVANFENTPGKSPFDVIDETLYGKEKFKTVKEKIDWVCSNFEKTQKELGE